MPLQYLLDVVKRSARFQHVAARLYDEPHPLSVSGLAGSSLPLFIAHLYRTRTTPTLVVVDTVETAEQVRDDLAGLLGGDTVYLFPDWEVRPYEDLAPDSDVTGLRVHALDVLRRERCAVAVASVRALMRKTLSPETFAETAFEVHTGDTIDVHDLLERCVLMGFERVHTVQVPGQISLRGGIVDLFPYGGGSPHRMELFGDEVESIRRFDAYTQRSVEETDLVRMLPNREIILDPSAERAATILAYLPAASLVCLCEPERLREQADDFTREIEAAYAAARETEEIVPEPAFLFESFERWEGRLSSYRVAHLVRSTRHGPDWRDLGVTAAGSYHGAIDVLKTRIAAWRNGRTSILIVCDNQGQIDRLSEILDVDAGDVTMLTGVLHAGFVMPDPPLAVLTDAEIFSRYRRRRRRKPFKEGVVIEDFTSLAEGDYVVHIDHGIGKYMGLRRLTVDDRTRDCLTIGYTDGDRLYIPIEHLHRVQKYIGADGTTPAVSRLGGKSWEQLKARTRKAVEDIARELVELYAARRAQPGFPFSPDTPWQHELEDSFIYEETPDQLKTTREIKKDMERASPMDRLVCGDVGYGKTEVAIRAAFKAVMDGKQVAVLVPTTILAQQHRQTFSERLADYPINIRMLSRFVTPAAQKRTRAALKTGEADIVIGTHRLIQRDIEFKDLGLVVVDEEQRFGVKHKERLKHLKNTVDVMTLTATPIPRTLHMSLVGARDMSIINTPPKERLPVHTEVVRFNTEIIREAVLREVDRGGQVYFVHNRVQSIGAILHFLQGILPRISFAVAHGQMPERELERVMIDFMDRKYDCLVSTMIIESGLDISNVNTIIVNRADRFGLAQLYQLRGRVGRSNHRAYAYLLIPSSGKVTPDARKRLAVIAEYTALGSGFHIAMRDLEIRGAGNILGSQQHGFMAAVGFDLYCRLLQEAIAERKGEPIDDTPEPAVDLQVDAFIPEDYITDRKYRVSIYQRLARMRDHAEVEALSEEINDRYGRLPDPTRALLELIAVKLMAGTARLRAILVRDRRLVIKYPVGEYPSKSRIAKITRDPDLAIEFPQAETFQIHIGLPDIPDAARLAFTKKLLQKLT